MLQITADNVASVLRARIAKASDFAQMKEKHGAIAMDSMKKDIEESRSPAGISYDKLKESTIRAKLRKGSPYANHPLLNSTTMYQSIHFEDRGPLEEWAGPDLDAAPYFARQNQGAPKRGIPARTFIGLRSEDLIAIEDSTLRHTSEAFGG